MMSLTFAEMISTSLSRSARWHDVQEKWTVSDWAVATSGEAGELSIAVLVLFIAGKMGELNNDVKKLRRIETGAPNINLEPGHQLSTRAEAIHKIGREMGDVILYMPALADALGIDLEACVKEVFNQKSEEYGFPERL